jgi:hypothetical protein
MKLAFRGIAMKSEITMCSFIVAFITNPLIVNSLVSGGFACGGGDGDYLS